MAFFIVKVFVPTNKLSKTLSLQAKYWEESVSIFWPFVCCCSVSHRDRLRIKEMYFQQRSQYKLMNEHTRFSFL